jgi:hypothetical protein
MQLRRINRSKDVHPCELFLAQLDDLREWPQTLELPGTYFTAFLVIDAREEDNDTIRWFANGLLDQGLVASTAGGQVPTLSHASSIT